MTREAETGTPPGRWIGAGVRDLDRGLIHESTEVTEPMLELLVGMGRDPVTGEQLGRAIFPRSGSSSSGISAGGSYEIELPSTGWQWSTGIVGQCRIRAPLVRRGSVVVTRRDGRPMFDPRFMSSEIADRLSAGGAGNCRE